MTFAHELANQSDTKTEAGIQNPSRAQNRCVCVCVVTKGKKQYFYVSSAALPLSTAQNAQNVEYFPTSEYFSCPRSFLSHASDLLKGKQIFHLSLEY